MKRMPRESRHCSFVFSTPPNNNNASCRASSRLMPSSTNFSICISMWNCSSSSISISFRSLLIHARAVLSSCFNIFHLRLVRSGSLTLQSVFFEHQPDGESHALPRLGFLGELFSASPGQLVVLGFAIVLG